MSRTRVVMLFGGRSAEHDVSRVSAASVLAALDTARYDVVPVGITRGGAWLVVEADGDAAAGPGADEGGGGGAAALPVRGQPVDPFDAVTGMVGGGAGGGARTVVFPLLHGPFGEDGTVQGMCELAGVPYVGSGVLGSAVCMDKVVAKRLLGHAGIPQPRHLAFGEWQLGDGIADRLERELGWPVFVKPANLGSSVGVSRVSRPGELDDALGAAVAYDEWVVVEEAITGRELECGVLGNREPKASVPGEIRPSRDFYDYDDKYVTGAAGLMAPAEVPPEVAEAVGRLALAAFAALRAEGMARVDFFYEEGGRGLLVNEVNTIPGFTPISMYPRLWEASGVPYPVLLDRLVDLALERHARRHARAR